MLDTSQDGWIIGRELRNRLKKLGLAQHVSEILRMMDFDGDSRISFDEFVMGYETVWATKVRAKTHAAMSIAGLGTAMDPMQPETIYAGMPVGSRGAVWPAHVGERGGIRRGGGHHDAGGRQRRHAAHVG
jgi:hypothetical protein